MRKSMVALNARLTIPAATSVGRQAPSKRAPSEFQNLDNVWISPERGSEKRPGSETMPFKETTGPNGFVLPHSRDGIGPFVEKFIEFSETERYLLVLDLGAPRSGSNKLFRIYALNQLTDEFEDHTPSNQPTNIPADVWTYVQHGSPDPSDTIRFCNVGTDLLVLNRNVKAGFTSVAPGTVLENGTTAVGGKLFDLNGLETGTNDVDGRLITYITAADVDPESEGILWTRYSSYSTGTVVYVSVDEAGPTEADAGVWRAKQNISNDTRPNATNTAAWEFVRAVDQVPIEDNKYPDPTKPWIGQSVPSFLDIKFPPLTTDPTAAYGNADAVATITSLYGSAGGKVYVTEGAYLNNPPGYYQIISSTTQPYSRRVRTPDWGSVIDRRRMPMRLRYNGKSGGISQWTWSTISWDPRTSGDRDSNPGPDVFSGGKQSAINAITFYRNRIWFAARDFVFSTAFGNYDNLFLANPGSFTDDDPIDQPASWAQYVTITDLVPFDSYLFVNTDSRVQFLLRGTDNDKMSPLTVELKPTSFYAADKLVRPQVIGSQIYFFAPRRLYMYIPNTDVINSPVEVSANAVDYLPDSVRSVTVAPAQDTIFAVDDSTPNHVYAYTNKYLGTQLVQSSFFRWVFREPEGESLDIRHLHTIGNYLYAIIERTIDGDTLSYIERVNLDPSTHEFPWVDRRFAIVVSEGIINTALHRGSVGYHNASYDPVSDQTTFLVPFVDEDVTGVILGSDWDDQSYASLDLSDTPVIDGSRNWMTLKVRGDYASNGKTVFVGRIFVKVMELSQQFYRDENGQVIDGVLNLRVMHLRHHRTGDYDVYAVRRNRPGLTPEQVAEAALAGNISDFASHLTSFRASMGGDVLPSPLRQADGELTARVLGYADVTTLYILSAHPSPCNITNIELHGMFRTKRTSHL
jgi:hypothetical protein